MQALGSLVTTNDDIPSAKQSAAWNDEMFRRGMTSASGGGLRCMVYRGLRTHLRAPLRCDAAHLVTEAVGCQS